MKPTEHLTRIAFSLYLLADRPKARKILLYADTSIGMSQPSLNEPNIATESPATPQSPRHAVDQWLALMLPLQDKRGY